MKSTTGVLSHLAEELNYELFSKSTEEINGRFILALIHISSKMSETGVSAHESLLVEGIKILSAANSEVSFDDNQDLLKNDMENEKGNFKLNIQVKKSNDNL